MTDPHWPVWFPWVTVLSAAALGSLYVLRVFARSINVAVFVGVVSRALAAGNPGRAQKLSLAVEKVPVAAATRAAIQVCARGVIHDASADYRSAGDLSPERVLTPVRAAFDLAFEACAAPIRTARYVAIAGAILLCAALAVFAAHPPVDPPPTLAAALALGILAWAGLKERGLIASRDASFAALAGSFDALIRDPSRAPKVDASPRVRVGFEVSEPGLAPRLVECAEEIIKIGSVDTAQVCLHAPRVARMHAVVEVTDASHWVIDLGSNPTTRVNGAEVTRCELSDGDVLSIGDAELRVRIYP